MHYFLYNGLHFGRGGAARVSSAVLAVAALALASCGGGGRGPEPAAKREVKPAAPPKIVQFYVSPPAVARGERALLCYGVEDAEAVRIEPEVEPLKPSLSRCVEVTPKQTTTYTLTAEGKGGRTTASLSLNVDRNAVPKTAARAPAGPAESTGPSIASFRAEKKNGPGDPVTLLCYEVEGAEAVQIEPAVMPRSGALRGCLGVAPEQPTTYFLTAFGSGGRSARRAITVSP